MERDAGVGPQDVDSMVADEREAGNGLERGLEREEETGQLVPSGTGWARIEEADRSRRGRLTLMVSSFAASISTSASLPSTVPARALSSTAALGSLTAAMMWFRGSLSRVCTAANPIPSGRLAP